MKIIINLIFLLIITTTAWSSQKTQVKDANDRFKSGQYDAAINGYINALEEKGNSELVQYNMGSAFYKKGKYDQAIEHLKKAESPKNKQLSSKASYNIGNAYYKKGRGLEEKNIDEAIDLLQKSLMSFEKSLNSNAKDADAKYNRTLVAKELERLKKKKQDQEKQGQEQKKDEKKSDKNKPSEKKDSQESKDSADQRKMNEQKDQEKESTEEKQDSTSGDSKEDKKEEIQELAQEKQATQKAAEQKEGAKEGEQQTHEQKQVKQILIEYEREDAPKGILNFIERRPGDEKHVDRDW